MEKKLDNLLETLAKKHYSIETILQATLLPTGAKEPSKMMDELIRIAQTAPNVNCKKLPCVKGSEASLNDIAKQSQQTCKKIFNF